VRKTNLVLGSLLFATACGDYETIEVDGRTREFAIYEPTGSKPADGWPMVFAYHGAFTTARNMQHYAQLDPIADEEGFLVVYPNGIRRVWHDGRKDSDIDDVEFTDVLIDHVINNYGGDENRLYVTGMSNGGFMSHRLACDLSDRVVAIAPVAGTLSQEVLDICDPSRPVHVMTFMGTFDDVVPYGGGELGGSFSGDRGTMLSAPDSTLYWAEGANCSPDPENKTRDKSEDGTSLETETYSGCDDDVSVVLHTIHEGGHTWPGADAKPLLGKTSTEINASKAMWKWFEDKSLD
jgi:polyhydroxybutyrate depolymerase